VGTGRGSAKSSAETRRGRPRRRRPAAPSAPGREPRALALRVIRRVTERRAYSNLSLAAELGRSGLPARDRQLAADLAYGTLRRLLILDGAIARAASRPLPDIDPEALALLRLGVYQLRFTRVPDHAAVYATVGLASGRHRAFVNAVLRTVAAESWEPPVGGRDEDVSARTGLAAWVVSELRRLLPQDEVEPAAARLASQADLALRTNVCRTSTGGFVAALRGAGFDARAGEHHPDVIHVASAVPTLLPGYQEGWFTVQDEASALVVAALQVQPGERILDACAGPGGKATHLACQAGPDGLVVAGDVRPNRAVMVRATAARLGVPVRVLAQDVRTPAVRGGFDAVLVDAPCSGLGAARRRPELLWRPRRGDLARLARLQVEILVGGADLVGPGGRLVYSVCTFPRAETEAAVRAFLAKRPEFEPFDIPGPDGSAPAHRLWPHRHGTDAMFYAGFRRPG
jgi:16S rRNA (cytosine967-C5)-methyltransferase